jgi:putative transposase
MNKTGLSGHGKYDTRYHIVWIAKYRLPILTHGIKLYLDKLFPKILEGMPGCKIVECNILTDHIHMVMIIPPKYAVKDVIGKLKGISSSKLRGKFNVGKRVWAPGYFVSTVGVAEDKIIDYVRNQ